MKLEKAAVSFCGQIDVYLNNLKINFKISLSLGCIFQNFIYYF
jgi:hypothetical protein